MPRLLPLLLLPVALAGCGGSVTTTVVGTPPPASRPASGVTRVDPPEAEETTSRPLAVRSGRIDDGPVKLELLSLHRVGRTTTLTLRLSTTSSEPLDIDESFDDGLQNSTVGRGPEDYDSRESLDGIFLVDGANATRYAVGRKPGSGACACDDDLYQEFVARGQPRTLSAVFGAPPPQVRTVDVFVPKFGTFTDVPLS